MFSSQAAVAALVLALPFTSLAEPHGSARHSNRHHELAKRAPGNIDVFKRDSFTDSRWTFFADGLGACGATNSPSDFIVALNTAQYGSGSYCFQMITMTYNGMTTQAQITDECPGCPYGGLDLSTGLFQFFAPESVGVLYGTWWFSDGSSDSSSSSTTPTSTYVYTPTSTYTPPTSSSVYTPPPSTSSSVYTPTSSSSSSTLSSSSSSFSSSSSSSLSSSSSSSSSSWSSSSSSAAASSSAASASATAGTLNDLEQVVMNFAGVIAGGAA